MSIQAQAINQARQFAIHDLFYSADSEHLPELWDRDRYERWTGEMAGSNYIAAIAFEDIEWDAIGWSMKFQRDLDPKYTKVIFEPYNSWLITIRDES